MGKVSLGYLLYVSKAGRRKKGGGRGGTGVLERVQMLKIFKVEMRVFYKILKLFHSMIFLTFWQRRRQNHLRIALGLGEVSESRSIAGLLWKHPRPSALLVLLMLLGLLLLLSMMRFLLLL